MQINGGDVGDEVLGGGTGALTITINDSDMIGSTQTGVYIDNVDAGTVTVNNATVDGNSLPAWDAGGVSGAEMIGSTITLLFTDGTTATGQLVSDGSQGGAHARLPAPRRP